MTIIGVKTTKTIDEREMQKNKNKRKTNKDRNEQGE